MFQNRKTLLLPVAFLVSIIAVAGFAVSRQFRSKISEVLVVRTFPHDRSSFVQGLAFDGEVLWEGSGLYGQSTLRKVDLESGEEIARIDLDGRFFGEGITILNDRIYQLTWKENVCFVYDKKTLQHLATYSYAWEGWGIATDGINLYVSDGSSVIREIDPNGFKLIRKINIASKGKRVSKLNELEFVRGELWANVWHTDIIARISLKNGEVTGFLDAGSLWPQVDRPSKENVLNGIAYDEKQNRIFVTGKNWPSLSEISVEE